MLDPIIEDTEEESVYEFEKGGVVDNEASMDPSRMVSRGHLKTELPGIRALQVSRS